jgi:hypothetical protein
MWGIVVFAIGGASCAAICPISNETNAFAVVSIQTDSNSFVILSFESCTDHVYVVSSADSLDSNAVWTAAAWVRGNQGTTSWTDQSAAGTQQQFYRVLRLTQNSDYTGGGIPNGWAVDHGLNPVDPNVAQEDPDGDGFNNLEEYLMGTDPRNSLSYPGCITNGFSNATNLIYVAKNGSDANSGTAGSPYLTIGKAATTAKTLSQSGTGSKIIIMPGTYGEGIFYSATSASLLASVVFSAATNGTVVISGVDVWTNGWTLMGGSTNVYQHSWTNTWGLAPIPSGWTISSNIVRRSEVVLVNGKLYTQVISLGLMKNGTYYVDDATNHLLYVQHRTGVDPSNAFYEVSQRTNLLTVTQSGSFQVANVALQGLEFRGAGTPLPNSAVQFNNASNVLVNACLFDYNNWCGMNFSIGNGITIRDCMGSHNGAMGIQVGFHEKNVVVDGVETDFNNWRGFLGNFLGFSIAGIKALNIHTGLFRNHVAVGNQTYGLWFDFDNKNVFIEGCVYNGNLKDGLQLEATEGPVRIQRVVSSRGQGSFALLCQNVEQMTVTNCAFIASGTSAGSGDIGCSVSTSRAVTDWETGANYTLFSSNWTLRDIATRSAASTQFGLYMLANFPGFLSTLTSDYNHWYNTGSNPLFTIGGTNYNLSQWRSLSGKDVHSDNVDLLVTLTPTQDTYLNLGTTTNTFGSATNAICDTQSDGTGVADVALLKFDPSSLTSAPRQAELQLAVSASSVRNGPVVFYAYRLTTAWDENATTAQAQPNSSLSWAAGTFSAADYDPQPVGVGVTAGGSGLNTFVDITALVQNWVGGVSPNYGVVVIAQPIWNQPVPDGSNLQQFNIGTREAASAQRPQISCIRR